jgi:uncharacterized 2Fe-2S/4Fe-4S cluster protein (DUF4445 family)
MIMKVLPHRRDIELCPEETLGEAIARAGIPINAHCGLKGKCGKCRIRIISGEPGPPAAAERKHLAESLLRDGWALACQRKAGTDSLITVEVPQAAANPVENKSIGADAVIEPDPHVAKRCIRMKPASMEDQMPDLERMLDSLPGECRADPGIIKTIPAAIRQSDFTATAVIFNRTVTGLEAGDTTGRSYGIAIDLGTTTVAGYLGDLETGRLLASGSTLNRQAALGADVVSRIAATLDNEKALVRLQDLAVDSINGLISELLEKSGVERRHVYLAAVVGNTTMSHLLLGVSPANLARSPFIPAFRGTQVVAATSIGMDLEAPARLIIAPNIAGYVGSDTVAAIAAIEDGGDNLPFVLIDIGTNAEIALFTADRTMTCSAAAGPAFEGAGIVCGMRAEPGAIDSIKINADVAATVLGGATPRGICGSGLIDGVAELLRLGIVTGSGKMKNRDEAETLPEALRERIRGAGREKRFVICSGENEIAVFQKDIRELQMAKGAIQAGLEILLKEAGLRADQIAGAILTGAFGSRLDIANLTRIGILTCPGRDRIRQTDNAAGLGAFMFLNSASRLRKAEKMAGAIEHIELAAHRDFQAAFVRCLNFEQHREYN